MYRRLQFYLLRWRVLVQIINPTRLVIPPTGNVKIVYHISTASTEVDSSSTFSDVNKLPMATMSIGANANKIPAIEMRQPTFLLGGLENCGGGGGGGHEFVSDTYVTLRHLERQRLCCFLPFDGHGH